MFNIVANFLFRLSSRSMLPFKDQVSPTCTKVDLRLLFTDGPTKHNILTPYRGLMQYLLIMVMTVGLILLL